MHARTYQIEPPLTADLELARLLELLKSNRAGALTIADLRERGVRAPSQAVYTLQLAGYDIDRVHFQDSDGHNTLGYRLRALSASPQDLPAAAPDGREQRDAEQQVQRHGTTD